ncbi:MAG: L-2-amino-thiazoline-4-carboxylic acid hydrolase [Lachnospiraceae bacterium]|nr:L-2-amino-thiazoline-4-carboxylic acid hydrolase [Lachnospiraceae bacterium]
MKTAAELMKKKIFLKNEMDKVMVKDESDSLWEATRDKLQTVLDKYGDLPAGVQSHTNSIFPAAAVYQTVREKYGDDKAYKIVEDGAIGLCAKVHPILVKIMKIPGMPSLFIKMWDPMTKKKFGPACGFKNKFYPKKKDEYKMDVIDCPYYKYFTELGCPELTKIYCDNDERIYGNLPGIKFERAGTIGKGADHCDFYIRRVR